MVIIMFTHFETFIYAVLINLVSFANLIWSFYRRWYDEINQPFTNNNLLLIRALSVINVACFIFTLKRLNLRIKGS